MKRLLITLSTVLVASSAIAASENLDELFSRKPRFAAAVWDKSFLETTPAYLWQPETMVYTDIQTGHEVWRMTSTNNRKSSFPDIGFSGFSPDGKRYVFGSMRDTSACTSSYETLDNYTYQGSAMIMRTDGSYLRPMDNAPAEVSYGTRYIHWHPTTPDIYYGQARNMAGEGLPLNNIYKVTVGDTSITKEVATTLEIASYIDMKKGFSGDGSHLQITADGKIFILNVGQDGAVTQMDSDGWAKFRQLDNYWGNTYPDTNYTFHDSFMVGVGNAAKLYFIPEGKASWWRYSMSGTAADGGPALITDHTAPFDWGGEIEPVMNGYYSGGTCTNPLYMSPWNCDGDATTGPEQYLSHPGFDRWGHYMVGVNSQQHQGFGVWDLLNHKWVTDNIPFTSWGYGHADWEAWSDYFVASPSALFSTDDDIVTHKYDGTGPRIAVVSSHAREIGSGDYNSLPRVTQSPDGTKLAWSGDFLYSVSNHYDIFHAVAYYPHAPEITSVTGTGTYTIRFDWRLGTENPRGYTKRGWPDEDVNDPPPPRETKLFRLWRSPSGSVGSWEPVAEVQANIFSRYNFTTGAWTGNDYWTITDTPGAGTWYYAVTAQEWSGLASKALSNVFSTAGVQTVAYPADPGAKVPFTAGFKEGIIRGWNIYASDAGTPAAVQQNRIATIPTASPKEYIDWLANPTATTYYTVTALDSQGFESEPLTITVTPSSGGVAGRNKIVWTSEVDPIPDPVCGDAGSPGLCTTESACLAVGFNWCSGACQIDACPALPSGTYPVLQLPGGGVPTLGGKALVREN